MLGSLMGDEEDVVKRMKLATVQFKSLEKVWGRVKSFKSRMNAYNAFILPVLLFNALGHVGSVRECDQENRSVSS